MSKWHLTSVYRGKTARGNTVTSVPIPAVLPHAHSNYRGYRGIPEVLVPCHCLMATKRHRHEQIISDCQTSSSRQALWRASHYDVPRGVSTAWWAVRRRDSE